MKNKLFITRITAFGILLIMIIISKYSTLFNIDIPNMSLLIGATMPLAIGIVLFIATSLTFDIINTFKIDSL